MKPDWAPLKSELAIWRAEHRQLPLWWRDDDATAPSGALDQLLALADDLNLPAHLAVIPKFATPALADRLKYSARTTVLVHGWAHANHAPDGAKKAEFGHARPDAAAQAQSGLKQLKSLFKGQVFAMFVPPWNRIDPDIAATLPGVGFCALSSYTPRATREQVPGLVQINTHMDPVYWRGGGGLVDANQQIAALVVHLQDRRAGRADAAEPLGFLTHHLVHDTAIWDFTRACLSMLLDGGAAPVNLRTLNGPLP